MRGAVFRVGILAYEWVLVCTEYGFSEIECRMNSVEKDVVELCVSTISLDLSGAAINAVAEKVK